MKTRAILVFCTILAAAVILGWVISGCATSTHHAGSAEPQAAQSLHEAGFLTPRADAQRSLAERMPPGSLPSPDEELWVIARADPQAQPEPIDDDRVPGSGAMLTTLPGNARRIPVPLRHTDVAGRVTGFFSTVDVTQRFHNPFDVKIEAVYVFPLPQHAAVNEFIMTIGDRRIRGVIRAREEAERIYEDAKRQGHTASLLTQQRPNVFTQKVANIEPGRQIDVHVRYFHTLVYRDGWYEWVFPMVIGPRFNPPHAADGIGAVGRGSAGASGQAAEVQYLRPDERSGHDVSLTLDIDAGVPIERLECPSHRVEMSEPTERRARLTLAEDDRIPNRDLVVRWRVAGDQIRTSFLAEMDAGDGPGHFALMLYPPADLRRLERRPVEMVFVIDCSGSMSGRPIEQAKAAIDRALDRLSGADTFQIIRFSNHASPWGPRPVPATADHIRSARRYLRELKADGGTMMIEGIRAALTSDRDPRRARFVVFLTDGYIGNETEILGEMSRRLADARVFSFGVGSAPNRYLMDRMAKLSRGAVAYLPLDAEAAPVMETFLDRVSHPALTDLRIDFGGLEVADVAPRRVPDLFVGRPVVLTGRLLRASPNDSAVVRIRGRAGGEIIEFAAPVDPAGSSAGGGSLAAVWARRRIADLMDRAVYEPMDDLRPRITALALRHNLASAYTAFIAADASRRTAGDYGVTVPVPVPDGVRYETTVLDKPAPPPRPLR